MDLMLRLNKITARAVFKSTTKGTTVRIKVDVEKHDNLKRYERHNADMLDEWLGYLNDTQGSSCWPRFQYIFKVDRQFPENNRKLAENFGKNVIDAMIDLDIFRGVKLESLSDVNADGEYVLTVRCGMA